jgi:hypothetical protein
MKEMKVKILPTGQVKILDIKGIEGKNCLEFTKSLETGLGEVIEREFTDDYYKEEYNTNIERQQQL